MRNTALLLASALLIPSVHAAPVVVKRPHIIYRATEGVAAACGAPKAACTQVNLEFYCGCERQRGGWTLVPTVIATPTIFASNDGLLRHELEHIKDINKSLNEYAAGLLMRSFPSEGSCREFVASEAGAFAQTAKSVRRSTTIKRDGIQFAGPADK